MDRANGYYCFFGFYAFGGLKVRFPGFDLNLRASESQKKYIIAFCDRKQEFKGDIENASFMLGEWSIGCGVFGFLEQREPGGDFVLRLKKYDGSIFDFKFTPAEYQRNFLERQCREINGVRMFAVRMFTGEKL